MTTFHLQIATMDGNVFDGQVQSVSCRTIHGDLAILARHMNYCTAIGMGTAHVVLEDGKESSLHRRNADHDERRMPSDPNYLGVERRHRRSPC